MKRAWQKKELWLLIGISLLVGSLIHFPELLSLTDAWGNSPEPENNPTLRSVIATCKRENMPKDNIERAIKNAMAFILSLNRLIH